MARTDLLQGVGAAFLAMLVLLSLAACGGVAAVQDPYNKAIFQYSQGNHDGAIAGFREALESNPDDGLSMFNLASVLDEKAQRLQRKKNPEQALTARTEAVAWYERIVSLQPRQPGPYLRARVNLAAMKYEDGDQKGGEADLKELAGLFPKSVLPRSALAAHWMREGRDAEAVPLLVEAREIDDESPEVNTLLAEAELRSGKATSARDSYLRALERNPDDLGALRGILRVHILEGRLKDARSYCQRMLYIRPTDFEAHLRLAEISDAAGETKAALLDLWEARDLDDGDHPGIQSPDYDGLIASLLSDVATLEAKGSADQLQGYQRRKPLYRSEPASVESAESAETNR